MSTPRVTRLMGMDDRVWARHMNPWSGYSRFTIFPLLTLALWSRVWMGWWSVLPVGLVLAWNWLNPRVFSPPRSLNAWVTRGVLGERVWLNRKNVPIPRHHAATAARLAWLSGLGLPFYAWGVATLQVWPTVFGMFVCVLFKVWFVDRMAWLWADMAGATDQYRAWQKPPRPRN